MMPSSAKRKIDLAGGALSGDGYVWHACRQAACRLRFPAPATLATGDCPRCGGPTAVATTADPDRKPTLSPPPGRPVAALLDNFRSVYNVGAAFRTADGAGLEHLYLGGITATPEHPRLAKTALGAETVVPWSHHPDGRDVVAARRAAGAQIVALEDRSDAQPLHTWSAADARRPVLLIVGNEKAGIDPDLLAASDTLLALPMLGRKRSLNVAVALGIGVYWLRFSHAWSAAGP